MHLRLSLVLNVKERWNPQIKKTMKFNMKKLKMSLQQLKK